MDNRSNWYYPNNVQDNTLKGCGEGCSCGKNAKQTQPKKQNHQPFFDINRIYPENYINQQNAQTQDEQSYNQQANQQNFMQGQQYDQQNNFVQGQQFEGQNSYGQQSNYGQQNNYGQEQNVYPHQQNQQKQKNMFGGLQPEQLMSLLSSKGNFSGLMGSLGNSNPQLSMLMGLMQNMPKTKKQSKKESEVVENNETKNYKKVKDFYKENSEENN